jgi:hypothetical protein
LFHRRQRFGHSVSRVDIAVSSSARLRFPGFGQLPNSHQSGPHVAVLFGCIRKSPGATLQFAKL